MGNKSKVKRKKSESILGKYVDGCSMWGDSAKLKMKNAKRGMGDSKIKSQK